MESLPRPRLVIGTSVPDRFRERIWGDAYFANDLVAAFRRRGWNATHANARAIAKLTPSRHPTVMLYLRGVAAVPSTGVPTAVWAISHPEDWTAQDRARTDLLVSASRSFAQAEGGYFLPQATDPARMALTRSRHARRMRGKILFVGNSRRERRTSVEFSRRAGLDITVFGRRWREVYPDLEVAGRSVSPRALGSAYRAADVVLNDHWPDMAAAGIVSNRIFDGLAAGAQIVTDDVADWPVGVRELVHVYRDFDEFVARVAQVRKMSYSERAERAERSRRLMVDQHSFDCRAEELAPMLTALSER